ncbi:MAG TPA: tetratricopeptide repeat protein [Vicinamibacterales bacterium]|nr:tetratricopeptide repeat protein [Vicinamibacterales bacterium]
MSVGISRKSVVALALLALATSCSKPSAEEHFKKGNAYFETSQIDNAILEYRLALEADIKRGDVHFKLAEAYSRKRDLGNAYKEYLRAADLLPDDANAQLKAGNYLLLAASYGAASFDDAKAKAKRVLDKDPNNIDAQILLANSLAGMKDFDAALAEYHEATTLNPTDDRAYSYTGILQNALGKKDEAEASFRKAVDVAPKSVAARMALGSFLWSNGRAPEAESVFKAALDLDPKNIAANRALGTFYMTTNRRKEAEPFFETIARTSNTAEDRITLAEYYIAVDRRDDARKLLTEIASNEKDFAEATIRLAALDAMEGARAQAHEKLRHVMDKFPKDMSARLLDARLSLIDGKREDALTRATSIVTEEPTSPQAGAAYLLIGGIQASFDKYDEAITAFGEASKRDRRPYVAQMALAALYLKTGALDKALSCIQQADAIQPKLPQTRALRTRVLLAQGKASEAKTELASLQKEAPGAPGVLLLVAAQQLIDKQYDAARASYTKVLQVLPNNLEAISGLISVDMASGKKADAIARIEAGLKSGTPTSDGLILAARTYAAAGDLDKAEDALNKAVESDPARLEAYALLGQLYAMQRKIPAAIEQFKKVIERTPNSVGANTMLGMLYEAQQQTPEAEKQYVKVLSLNPRAAVAANNLAWLYVASNRNLDEALQLAQTALQSLPGEPHVTDTLGWIYYRKDLPAQAVPYLESSVEKNPNDPAGHYHLGMAYVRAGEIEKGKKSLQRALASKTEFDGVAEARKTLAQLGGL